MPSLKTLPKLLSLALLLLPIVLSACGTTSRAFDDIQRPQAKGTARIIIERDTSLLFLGAGAVVQVNGVKVANLGRGGGVVRDVPAGRVRVEASATSAPGQYVVHFDAAAGKAYRFMVSPKSDAMFLGAAFGVIGDVVNAQISDTSGYFIIEMVP